MILNPPKIAKLAHLSLIMDGNRRWAAANNLPKLEGHRRGYDKVKQVCDWCIDREIKILTVYAFSSENWNREPAEVSYLMNLFRTALLAELEKFHAKGVRIKVIGQLERLSEDIQKLVVKAEQKTANNTKLLLQLAISYGGRPEIVQAIKKIISQKISAENITEEIVEKNLWTAGTPDPDLIIRTSGEHRLSNFLLWQSAYSELLFIQKHWPDFSKQDLDSAIAEFESRQRR